MNISSNIIILTIVIIHLLVQAMGLFYNRLAFTIIGLLIVCFFLVTLKKNYFKKFYINKPLPILIVLFFLVSLISATQGVDINRSLILIGELGTTFALAVLIVNKNTRIATLLPDWIIIIGFFLCIYSLFLIVFPIESLMPINGYQLVFSKFGSHNHLGDFLVLPLLISFYYLTNSNKGMKYIVSILFFLPFFFLSFSRSAYLSFLIVTFVYVLILFFKGIKKRRLIVPIVSLSTIILLTAILFLGTVYEARQVPKLKYVHETLVSYFGLKFKHFNANRFEFTNSAIQSIKQHPWIGIGTGNFMYASEKFSTIPNYRTHSSHNIFLDIFVENGIFAIFLFLSIVIIILKKTLQNFSLYSLLFISLLINFQTDLTFRIIPMLFLFIIFVVIIIRDEKVNV